MSSTDPVQPHALPEYSPGPEQARTEEIPSVEAMQAQEDRQETIRFRELLRAALCSAPVELDESILYALPDESANARLNALLHGALRSPILPDLSDAILDALTMAEDTRVGDALRAELGAESALLGDGLVDGLADSIFEALDASLDAPRLGAALHGAVHASTLPEDFADDILGALELGQPDARLTQALQASVQPEPGFDLSDAVLDGILDALEAAQPAQTPASRRASLRSAAVHPVAAQPPSARTPARPSRSGFWGTLSMVAPAVATLAILLVLFGQPPNPNLPEPTPGNLSTDTTFRNGFAILDQNEAEVEDIAFAAASVQVMQFEDNGPTFILVDEGEPSDTTVPL